MVDLFFVILYVLVPVTVVFIAKYAGISLFRITIPSIFLLAYFLFAYIGILPLYFYWDEYRYAIGITDRDILLRLFYYSSVSLFMIAFGFVFIASVLKLKSSPSVEYKQTLSPIEKSSVLLIAVLCCTVFIIYLSELEKIPLLYAFTADDKLDIALLRSKATNDFSGMFKYHWYYTFFAQILPFLTYILFADALIRRKVCSYLIFALTFCAAFFAAIVSTEKAPALWLIIGLTLIYLLIRAQGRISFRIVMILSLLLVAVLIPMYLFFMQSADAGSAFMSVMSRTFTGSVQPGYHYLEMFPAYQDYLLGKSLPNPGGVLPFENYRLTREVYDFVFPEISTKGIVGSIPATFWAEVYANFGPIAPLIAAFFIGAVVFSFHAILSKLQNSPVKAALIVWVTVHFMNLTDGGVSSYLADSYLAIILLISIGISLLSNVSTLIQSSVKKLSFGEFR